jgi:formylglycine-generating enzyme required for sulfatase activity
LKDYDARPESAEAMAQMLRDDDPRSHTKEHEENKQEAPIRTIAPGKQTQATALKETLDTAIRLNEWEEAERVLNELSQLAPDDSSLTIYRKRVEREMQPIREARRKAEEAEAERKRTEIKWIAIPAGEFLYGDKKEKKTLPAFQIAKTPVTNVQYYQFVKATKHDSPSHWQNGQVPQGLEDHPVVYVSWDDAQEFCKWAKCRLPTEEEWEKAARGTDGRSYPWGNEQPTKTLCNFNNNEKGTTPVGKYSPQGDSPYGCVDMSGNVWEWTESAYVSNTRVLRGGSFYRNQRYVRSAYRGGSRPRNRDYGYGFRVVVSSGSRP